MRRPSWTRQDPLTSRALQGGADAKLALLLIDCQQAFLSGYWAQHFGVHQMSRIEQAFQRTEALLRRPGALSRTAVLCTKCYTDGEEAEYPETLNPLLRDVPCVWKPTTNVTLNPLFHSWLEAQLARGIRTLVIGGCTTTSCVRVSSQAVLKAYAQQGLRVVVDRSLCGARDENYLQTAAEDPDLVNIYGLERCKTASPVDLAEFQMVSSGVEVVDEFDWEAANSE